MNLLLYEYVFSGRVVSRSVGGRTACYAYAPDGLLASVSNDAFRVEYLYTTDRRDAGYVVTTTGGVEIARHVVRDDWRRHLVTGVSNEVGGAPVRSFTYSHDALGRPVRRIDATPSGTSTNTFSYNARSEVVSAFLGGVAATYSYDPAGNRTASSSGASPSSYAANALNQYETVATGNATNALVHGDWGNLVQTAHHTCYYAWGNLLECVCTNRTRFKPPCAFFFYDALGRRCRKSSTPYGGHDWTHRYCHSGWLLLLEEVRGKARRKPWQSFYAISLEVRLLVVRPWAHNRDGYNERRNRNQVFA